MTTQIFKTSGTTLAVDATYTDSGAVWEAIGAGGNGGVSGGSAGVGGAGGGGGAYKKKTTPGLSASTTYDIQIPSGGTGGTSAGNGTWIKNGAGGGGAIVLEAENGQKAVTTTFGAGGRGTAGTGDSGNAGGAGGSEAAARGGA